MDVGSYSTYDIHLIMKISLENDKGYVIVDDLTGKIIYVMVHNIVENKRDFISLASYTNNPDGTQTATRFIK